MSYVPYPPPPPMRGPVDNPGRQPTVKQALAMIAGLVLLLAVLAALSVGDSVVGLVVAAGAAGFLLGASSYVLARHRVPHGR